MVREGGVDVSGLRQIRVPCTCHQSQRQVVQDRHGLWPITAAQQSPIFAQRRISAVKQPVFDAPMPACPREHLRRVCKCWWQTRHSVAHLLAPCAVGEQGATRNLEHLLGVRPVQLPDQQAACGQPSYLVTSVSRVTTDSGSEVTGRGRHRGRGE